MERLGERVVADARLLAHHLGERPDRRGRPTVACADPFEEPEPVGDQDAAGRRRRVQITS